MNVLIWIPEVVKIITHRKTGRLVCRACGGYKHLKHCYWYREPRAGKARMIE